MPPREFATNILLGFRDKNLYEEEIGFFHCRSSSLLRRARNINTVTELLLKHGQGIYFKKDGLLAWGEKFLSK